MRVLVADDQPEVRSALRFILENSANMVVVGEAADGRELLSQVARLDPDLVLLDWELPADAGRNRPVRDAARYLVELRRCCAKVLVIAMSGRPEARQTAVNTWGADGFVCKGEPPERLLDTLSRLRRSCC